MAAPTILRTQHKLGDYLFEPDLAKFNLPKKTSRPWIINNAFEQNKLKDQVKPARNVTEREKVNNSLNMTMRCSRTSPSPTHEDISNKNYLENTSETINNQQQILNNITAINDNDRFSLNHKSSKSPKVKSKMNTKHLKNKGHLNQLHNKNTSHSESQPQNKNKELGAHVNTDQDTEVDRINTQKIQMDKELEYQNQINQMYNDPQYMDQLEQYYHPAPPQPALHHMYQDHPMAGQILYHDPIFTHHVVQQPPMYFIALPLPLDEPTPMTMTPDTGSDYSSEDGSCYELNVSSDSSDDEVFETNLQPEAFTSNYTGVPEYKEPDYEVPIEMDEELNMLVLSIIDD